MNITKNTDAIFKHNNLTDFEKVLFLEKENKELKIELGAIKMRILELEYISKDEIKEIRKQSILSDLGKINCKLNKTIRQLRLDNEYLITKVLKLEGKVF